jgi:hypothetical protein
MNEAQQQFHQSIIDQIVALATPKNTERFQRWLRPQPTTKLIDLRDAYRRDAARQRTEAQRTPTDQSQPVRGGAAMKPRFPGWKMSVSQHHQYIRLWTAACAAQGWDKLPSKERDAKRKEVHARVFGFAISATEIDGRKGCDAIFGAFEELANRVAKPVDGERRRLIHVAAERIDVLAAATSLNYVETLLKERFKLVRGIRSIGDLSNPDLLNLLRTVNSRIDAQTPATASVASSEPW